MSKPGEVIELDDARRSVLPPPFKTALLSPDERAKLDKALLERSFIRDEREAHEKNVAITRAASYAVHSLRIACGSGRALAYGDVADEIEAFIIEKLREANNG